MNPVFARISDQPVTGPDAAPVRFAGYAALFDKRDAGGDVIRRGAFAHALAQRASSGEPFPLFWQHRPDRRIGWVDYIAEDEKGLRVIGRFDNPEHPAAKALKDGAVSGISFGYRATEAVQNGRTRELRQVDLFEVSLVTHPMQPLARVHMIA